MAENNKEMLLFDNNSSRSLFFLSFSGPSCHVAWKFVLIYENGDKEIAPYKKEEGMPLFSSTLLSSYSCASLF